MTRDADRMTRHIRRSVAWLLLAFALEVASLAWRSPLAFFLFLGGAGGAACLGIGSFLLALVRTGGGAAPQVGHEPPR